MTLTKSDLSQIRQAVKSELRDYPSKDDLKATIKAELKDFPTGEEIKKEFKRVNRNIKTSFHYLDKEHLKLKKRVEKVEIDLGIAPPPLTI